MDENTIIQGEMLREDMGQAVAGVFTLLFPHGITLRELEQKEHRLFKFICRHLRGEHDGEQI